MMKNIVKIVVLQAILFLPFKASADESLKVVTTLSSYADIAKAIGGEFIGVSSIASPKFNPHFIEARPSDVYKLKKADLFIHSGLDLEAWRGPLLDAAARSDLREGGAKQLDLSKHIQILEVPTQPVSRSLGDIHVFGNPHYWIDPRNGLIIAHDIAAKLIESDPAHATFYETNAKEFEKKLSEKMLKWSEELRPFAGKEVIGYHNEWPYLMGFAGLRMEEFIEPKPGIPPSPRHLEELENSIRERNIRVLIQASFYSKDAGEFLSEQSGIKVATICQSVGELPECPDYISMVDFAVNEIVKGLSA